MILISAFLFPLPLASIAAPAGMVRIICLPLNAEFGVSRTVQTVPAVTSVKSEAVPRVTARSAAVKPVTTAENVIVAVTGSAVLGPGKVIVTVGSPVTTMSKLSEAVPPLPSLAVTFTDSVPSSAAAGVPEKVRVAASKLSQFGNAESSDSNAV